MKKVILLCFVSSFAFAQSRAPLGQVKDYAAQQNAIITITRRSGFVWLEMSGSEVFGTGRTVDEAAGDFLADLDLVSHEADPADILSGRKGTPFRCREEWACL